MLILDSVPLYFTLPTEQYAAELLHIPIKHYMSASGCQLELCLGVIAPLQPAGCALRCELDAKKVDGRRPYLFFPLLLACCKAVALARYDLMMSSGSGMSEC